MLSLVIVLMALTVKKHLVSAFLALSWPKYKATISPSHKLLACLVLLKTFLDDALLQ
jgi:hypothetical protein